MSQWGGVDEWRTLKQTNPKTELEKQNVAFVSIQRDSLKSFELKRVHLVWFSVDRQILYVVEAGESECATT